MGYSMVWVQNLPFFHLFILGNIGKENVFYNIPEGKSAFLGYKKKKFKKSKNWDFSNVVSPWFLSKIVHFPIFILPGECVLRYCRRKKSLSRVWKQEVTKAKKLRLFFPKGLVHGFGPKLAIFPSFYFKQCRPGKGVLTVF